MPKSTTSALKTTTRTPAVERDRRGDRLLNTNELKALLRCSDDTIRRRRDNDPDFPKPVPVRKTYHGWWESDVMAYLALIQQRVAA